MDEERAGGKRAELFNLIEELVRWENINNPVVIDKARAEIYRCVSSRKIELGELQKETIIFDPEEGESHPDGPLPNDGRFTAWQINCRILPSRPSHFRISVQSAPNLLRHSARTAIPFDSNKIRNPHSGLAMPHGIERVLDVININNNIAPAIK
ncbi:MAG: hypothetical protein SV686_11445 [Thermodesulfobacteriota bacterium]|nr:hypothetical protein [Thermodesulfobacteriota bacterium]